LIAVATGVTVGPRGVYDGRAGGYYTADFLRQWDVGIVWDGAPLEHPDQRRVDETVRRELMARGYRVVVVRWDEGLEAALARHPEVFRAGRV